MKRKCKVKPSGFECHMCSDIAESCNTIPDCVNCVYDEPCELISVGSNFWSGDYAMILRNGQIEKVSLDRVYDVETI